MKWKNALNCLQNTECRENVSVTDHCLLADPHTTKKKVREAIATTLTACRTNFQKRNPRPK